MLLQLWPVQKTIKPRDFELRGSERFSFTVYDANGLRVGKGAGSSSTYYIYGSDGQVVSERDANNNWLLTYIHFGGQLTALYSGSGTYFFHKDNLGSVRLGTDVHGNVTSSNDYLPFGEHTGGNASEIQFTGYPLDAESGLNFASARHYSSSLGRFMSPDLLSGSPGYPQSWNRCSYVMNNPLNATDPSGMCSEEDGWSDCDSGDDGGPNGGAAANAYLWYWGPGFDPYDASAYAGYLNYSYGDPLAAGPGFQTGGPIGSYPNDGSIMSQIMNNPTTAASWTRTFNSASDWVDVATTYTVMQGTSVFGAAVPIIGKTLYYLQLASLAPAPNYSGYFGYDAEGNVKYVGITKRNPPTRWGEHENAIDTGRENLRYRVVDGGKFANKAEARIWEQRMILRYGLQKNGGQLLNLRNEIAPKYWKLFQILEELE